MKTTLNIIDNSTHHHYHGGCDPTLRELLVSFVASTTNLLESIKMNIEELKSKLAEIQANQTETNALIGKVSTDTTVLLDKIEQLGQMSDLPEEVAALVNDITSQSSTVRERLAELDARVPEAEPTPEPTPE